MCKAAEIFHCQYSMHRGPQRDAKSTVMGHGGSHASSVDMLLASFNSTAGVRTGIASRRRPRSGGPVSDLSYACCELHLTFQDGTRQLLSASFLCSLFLCKCLCFCKSEAANSKHSATNSMCETFRTNMFDMTLVVLLKSEQGNRMVAKRMPCAGPYRRIGIN